MSFIKDTFFGGAEKKAAKAQTQAIQQGQAFTREGVEQARQDLFKLFPAAQQNLQQGFQGALDIFGQSLPAQTNVFQQGNVAAQQQLLAGLPQFQNAILGNQVDFSALQSTQLQMPDLGFFQQQLPQFIDPFAPPPPITTQDQNNMTDNPSFQLPPSISGFAGATSPALGGLPLGGKFTGGGI